MAHRLKNSSNGRFSGIFYETANGKRIYLAHRKMKDVSFKPRGWCLDVRTLERCKEEGYYAVGVVCKSGKERSIWLTHVDDFFNSPHSFPHFDGCRQRGLPLSRFRIDPAKSVKFIEKSVRIS